MSRSRNALGVDFGNFSELDFIYLGTLVALGVLGGVGG
jgi:hypothetical protein